MIELKEYLETLTVDPNQVFAETVGDEKLWAVEGCTQADIAAFVMDPVNWVLNLPGGGFKLLPDFVIQFVPNKVSSSQTPPYLVSGIAGTNIVVVRVEPYSVLTPPDLARHGDHLLGELNIKNKRQVADKLEVSNQIIASRPR